MHEASGKRRNNIVIPKRSAGSVQIECCRQSVGLELRIRALMNQAHNIAIKCKENARVMYITHLYKSVNEKIYIIKRTNKFVITLTCGHLLKQRNLLVVSGSVACIFKFTA